MGARKEAVDIQQEIRRQVAARLARAPAKRPSNVPKPQTSQAIIAAKVDQYGVWYLSRSTPKQWYFASTPHLERAFRFATVAEAQGACGTAAGFEPVIATLKASFRRPESGED